MYNFKDFRSVDARKGMGDEINHQAMRAKKASADDTSEALSLQQRLQRARQLRKNKSKIRMGKLRAARKVASPEKLKQRARRTARNAILLKLTRNIPKGELTVARKQELEKKLDKMKSKIERLAMKLLPKIRKAELQKKQGGGSGDN